MSFFGFVCALAIALAAAWLFYAVAPVAIAIALAVAFFAIELAGGSNRGTPIRAAMRGDAILLAWPLAAVALEFAGVPDRGLRIAIAAGIAAAFAGVAAGRASGEDDARMRLLIVSALIVGYAVLRNITRPTLDSCAIVAASIAAAVPLAVVAGGGLVLPDRHRVAVGFASAACAGVGAALGAGFYLHSHFF